MHRINAVEWAIQTFKNHLISGLCTVDTNFPMQLWGELLEQAEISLNLLRHSRINGKLFAYVQLEGPFNFNKTPLAPVGCRALMYHSATTRGM